jgi:hypothetical protein
MQFWNYPYKSHQQIMPIGAFFILHYPHSDHFPYFEFTQGLFGLKTSTLNLTNNKQRKIEL